jgi:hypothetical protein
MGKTKIKRKRKRKIVRGRGHLTPSPTIQAASA